MEAQVMGAAAGSAGAQAHAHGSPGLGEAQAIKEVQRAWMDVRRRTEMVEREERDSKWQEERSQGGRGTKGYAPL